jgi:hypothetical protein
MNSQILSLFIPAVLTLCIHQPRNGVLSSFDHWEPPYESDPTLSIQRFHRIRNAVLRVHPNANANVILHAEPFEQLDPSLLTQLLQDLSYLAADLPAQLLLPVLRNDSDVLDTAPPRTRQAFPFVHVVLPPSLLVPSRRENQSRSWADHFKALGVALP